MATVTTSIGQGTSHMLSVNITNVTGSGPYTVTLSAPVPAAAVVGDALQDENSPRDKFLITAISGSELTVVDSEGVGAGPDFSGSNIAYIERYYNGSTPVHDWAISLDNTDLYSSGDAAIGVCYDDVDFTGGLVSYADSDCITTNTAGLSSVTLTVAESDRHDGTAGTGVVMQSSGINDGHYLGTSGLPYTTEWIEFDFQGYGVSSTYSGVKVGTDGIISNCILHNSSSSTATYGAIQTAGFANCSINNCMIWDFSSGGSMTGIEVRGSNGNPAIARNCTVYGITSSGSAARGITPYEVYQSRREVHNCISAGTNNTGVGTAEDFYNSQSTNITYCLSTDGTAAGTGAIPNGDPAFLSTTSGSEDLRLASTSDAINAGTDLGSTYSIDITGKDRDGYIGNWDIGADQYDAFDTEVTTTIGQGDNHTGLSTETIISVEGTNPYLITMSASLPADVVVGDRFLDEASTPNEYLIREVSGTQLSVLDVNDAGLPDSSGTTQADVERFYDGSTPVTDWKNGSSIAEGKTYVGLQYADAVITEAGIAINLSGPSFSKLTVAESDRHDGTAGTGVHWNVATYNSDVIASVGDNVEISWIDFEGEGTGGYGPLRIIDGGYLKDEVYIHHNICRSATSSNSATYGIFCNFGSSNTGYVYDNVIYGLNPSKTGYGVRVEYGGIGLKLYNNTIYGCGTHGVNISSFADTYDLQNCISMDNGSADFANSELDTTTNYCMSSDDTADDDGGTGHIINASSATQFLSTASGSEDLRLASTSDAIAAGTDLGSTYSIDISGKDRDGYIGNWDIGADQYDAYDTTVTLSIGQGTTHDDEGGVPNISAVTGTGPYLITLGATAYADMVVGDHITDGSTNKYCIRDISGTSLSVLDLDGNGTAPVTTGTATYGRYYSGSDPITDWEADLDDTNIYASGNDAVGVCYADANFSSNSTYTINGGGTVGLNSITLTAADSEWHEGVAGSGAQVVYSSQPNGYVFNLSSAACPVTLSKITIDYNESSSFYDIGGVNLGADDHVVDRMIIHSARTTSAVGYGIADINNSTSIVKNCIVYDLESTRTASAPTVYGFQSGSGVWSYTQLMNCTFHNIKADTAGGSGVVVGVNHNGGQYGTVRACKNVIMTDPSGESSSTCFTIAAGVDDATNMSSDGTGDVASVSSSAQFLSTTGGSEDLRLTSTSDAIDAGTDLGADYATDIAGNTHGDDGTWDIGAYEYQGTLNSSSSSSQSLDNSSSSSSQSLNNSSSSQSSVSSQSSLSSQSSSSQSSVSSQSSSSQSSLSSQSSSSQSSVSSQSSSSQSSVSSQSSSSQSSLSSQSSSSQSSLSSQSSSSQSSLSSQSSSSQSSLSSQSSSSQSSISSQSSSSQSSVSSQSSSSQSSLSSQSSSSQSSLSSQSSSSQSSLSSQSSSSQSSVSSQSSSSQSSLSSQSAEISSQSSVSSQSSSSQSSLSSQSSSSQSSQSSLSSQSSISSQSSSSQSSQSSVSSQSSSSQSSQSSLSSQSSSSQSSLSSQSSSSQSSLSSQSSSSQSSLSSVSSQSSESSVSSQSSSSPSSQSSSSQSSLSSNSSSSQSSAPFAGIKFPRTKTAAKVGPVSSSVTVVGPASSSSAFPS